MPVNVRCVHASKGVSDGAGFEVADTSVPRGTERILYNRGGQGAVWSSVNAHAHMAAETMAASGVAPGGVSFSDDLVGNMERVRGWKERVGDVVKDIPIFEQQVGVVILDVNGVVGFEAFDHPDSWMAFHEDVAEKYGDLLGKEEEEPLFDLREEAIPGKIGEFLGGAHVRRQAQGPRGGRCRQLQPLR